MPPAAHGGPSAADLAAPPIRVDFSTSVNAYGPAPNVVAAVRDALDPARLAAYPEPTSAVARAAIAESSGVASDAVAVGAGATELILAVTQAFVRPGDRVLVPPLGFGEYARAAMLCGAEAIEPLRGARADMPIDDLAAAFVRAVATQAPRVAFLCTPESPSGRAWPSDAVRLVADGCARAGTLLVLDQSFDPFLAAPLGTPALRDHAATLHLRSLTKDHALAGLRVGYVVGPAAIVAAVERARMPWMVSAPAQAAAVAACAAEALAHVRDTATRLRESAAALRAAAARHGSGTVASDTHYLLLDVGDAPAFTRALRERHGLKVRDCTSFGLPSHVRVAARTPDENALLVAAFEAIGGPAR